MRPKAIGESTAVVAMWRAPARAVALVLCVLLVAAGVLHAVDAHAAEHAHAPAACADVDDLPAGPCANDAGLDLGDPCSGSIACTFHVVLPPGASSAQPKASVFAGAHGEPCRGTLAAPRARPPQLHLQA